MKRVNEYTNLLEIVELGYDVVDDTEPLERFFMEDFRSLLFVVVDVGFSLGSFFKVTVKTPSVDEFPLGLLILILTVDVLSLDDKCSVLLELWSAPAM